MAGIERLAGSKVKLTCEVSAEEFEAAVEKAYFKTRKNIAVPGFRKGHAPRKVIENAYGWEVFFEDAFDIVYPAAYKAAVDEHGVKPVEQPDLSIVEAEKEKPVIFIATVAVVPEVTLGQYKGIEVEKRAYNVTDEMVEREIDRERDKIARMIDVERPVENGDEVELDYSGTVDGELFEGGTAEGQTLTIGSGAFIPGFEEQMIGMSVGEERDLAVKFPEEYHSEELKGKDAVFHVKVHAIRVKELPEADDEFAQDVSDCQTIAELRGRKRAELSEKEAQRVKIAKENDVIRAAVANAEVEIPDAMVDRQVDRMLNDFAYRLSMQGISLEDYVKYSGLEIDAMRQEMRGDAEARVKNQLVIEAIVKAEGVKAEAEEIDAKIDEYVKQYGDKAEEIKTKLGEDDRGYFEEQAVMEKTIALVVDSAVEVEKAGQEEKPKTKSKKKTAEAEPAE
ncbi:MAG TPA: trigger factor [Clostridia bacterium]|nr:trigger factor [Clostridia bacterium]